MGNKEELTHILVECPELIPTVKIGVLKPLELYDNIRYKIKYIRTIDIKKEDIIWCDVLICVRGMETLSLQIVKEAKKFKKFIIYYLDDDLLNLPEDSILYNYYNDEIHKKCLKKIIEYSDVLWGVNEKIKQKYLHYTKTRRWIWNRLPMEIVESNATVEEDNGPVKILFAGSKGHENTVRDILSPVVRRLCAEEGERITFTFIGVDPKVYEFPQVKFINYFDSYNEYRDYVDKENFIIGLAVVKLEEFYQCKYYNKYVEYSSINAVGVYTDCDLYRQIIKDDFNGILCKNDLESWTKAIKKLLNDKSLRESCLRNALNQIREEFNPNKVCNHLLMQVPELYSYKAPIVKCSDKININPIYEFYSDRILYLFRVYGVFAIFIIPVKAIKKIAKLCYRRIK